MKLLLVLVLVGVVVCNVQGYSARTKLHKNDKDLLAVLRKTLAIFEARYVPGNGGFTGENGPNANGGSNANGRPNANAGPNANGGSNSIGTPDIMSSDFSFRDLKRFYRFPGSDFLVGLVLRWLHEPLPTDISEIETADVPPVDETLLNNIETIAPQLFQVINDTEIFGEFMAKILTKVIVDAHTNCPSALMNKFTAILWEYSQGSIEDQDHPLFEIFNRLLPEFFPGITDNADVFRETVAELVQHTWDTITDDTESFILGLEFFEVSQFSRRVYETFTDPDHDFNSNFQTVLSQLRTANNGLTCKGGACVQGYQERAIQAFFDEFSVESEDVFETISETLEKKLTRLVRSQNRNGAADILENANWDVLDNMTVEIHELIVEDVIPSLREYLGVMRDQDTVAFLQYFDILDEQTITVLREVLRLAGWTLPDVPETTEVPTTVAEPDTTVVVPDTTAVVPDTTVSATDQPTTDDTAETTVVFRKRINFFKKRGFFFPQPPPS